MAAVEVLHAGWATKEGGLVKNWQRRYFVLRTRLAADRLEHHPGSVDATHVLLYFKSSGHALAGEAPTGAIPITPGATVVTEHVRKNKRCVKIKNPGDVRAYFLLSEGGGAGNASWIEALTTLSTPDNSAELRRMTLGDRPPAAVAHPDGGERCPLASAVLLQRCICGPYFPGTGIVPVDPTFAAAAAAAAAANFVPSPPTPT